MEPHESWLSYFKRSFELFKLIRYHIKGIINNSNLKREVKYHEFLMDFKNRYAPLQFYRDINITFQVECVYKSYGAPVIDEDKMRDEEDSNT